MIETIYLEKKEKRSESSLYPDISIGCQDTERLKISMAKDNALKFMNDSGKSLLTFDSGIRDR